VQLEVRITARSTSPASRKLRQAVIADNVERTASSDGRSPGCARREEGRLVAGIGGDTRAASR
jgi:hypothetical protein